MKAIGEIRRIGIALVLLTFFVTDSKGSSSQTDASRRVCRSSSDGLSLALQNTLAGPIVIAENPLRMHDHRVHASASNLPFDRLVTQITWPRGQDGTDTSLIAYGPNIKNPRQGYSSQIIWWNVDITKVAAVDVAINGKHVDNPKDAKQTHTAIYRLGGQAIPGYTGREGYFAWMIWPAGDFRFDFTVFDDAGNIIGKMHRVIEVAHMSPATK